MACLKMILEYCGIASEGLITLAKECEKYGAYRVNATSIDGLYYKPFIEFISDRFNLAGEVLSPLPIDRIISETRSGNIIIASVHPSIRNADHNYNGKKGGHLIVITGCDENNEYLFIHNPSGDTKSNQEYCKVKLQTFSKYYAERGMAVKIMQ